LSELVGRDPLLASRLFDVPSEGYLGSRIDQNYALQNGLLAKYAQARFALLAIG
jgi:hypothetical protein